MYVGTRYPAVQDVAHYRHPQLGEIFFVMADGVHVEQTLGRVRVSAVTSVHYVNMGLFGID